MSPQISGRETVITICLCGHTFMTLLSMPIKSRRNPFGILEPQALKW